jgi:hypothetical protein
MSVEAALMSLPTVVVGFNAQLMQSIDPTTEASTRAVL